MVLSIPAQTSGPPPPRAICLLSGGADSILAMHLLARLGVELVAVHFVTCFFERADSDELRRQCRAVGARFLQHRFADEYMRMLAGPKFGYGKAFNPCTDCHILMLSTARHMLGPLGAGFVATGEVLGQRPMSQHMRALRLVEAESGLRGRLLRPLSAKRLPPTLPELSGLVDRGKLLGIEGRSRKAQLVLAEQLGLGDLPGAGGGCLLTDNRFAQRVRDLFDNAGPDAPTAADARLLRAGRMFRFSPDYFVIVGKNSADNAGLLRLSRPEDTLLFPPRRIRGPVLLARGRVPAADHRLLAALVLRYSDVDSAGPRAVRLRATNTQALSHLEAEPMSPKDAESFLV